MTDVKKARANSRKFPYGIVTVSLGMLALFASCVGSGESNNNIKPVEKTTTEVTEKVTPIQNPIDEKLQYSIKEYVSKISSESKKVAKTQDYLGYCDRIDSLKKQYRSANDALQASSDFIKSMETIDNTCTEIRATFRTFSSNTNSVNKSVDVSIPVRTTTTSSVPKRIEGTCKQLRAMGIYNIPRGDINYTSGRDKDNDGIGCEYNR